MNIAIVVYSNDPETVWNAFRFANFSLSMHDEVSVFLLGHGVECESLDTDRIKVNEQLRTFSDRGGKIFACGVCLEFHQLNAPELFTVSTMKDLYELIRESDKIVTF